MFECHWAERRNAGCLRLISFVTLKVGERRRNSRPTCSLFAANIVYSILLLSFSSSPSLSSFAHYHTSPPLLIPFPCNAYSLIASVLVTTLLHSLVQTATCETDKHPISPSILASIQSTGRLAAILVLV